MFPQACWPKSPNPNRGQNRAMMHLGHRKTEVSCWLHPPTYRREGPLHVPLLGPVPAVPLLACVRGVANRRGLG